MKLFEGKSPAERNKLIAAMVFGVLALALILNMFIDWSGPKSTNQNSNNTANKRTQSPADVITTQTGNLSSPSEDRDRDRALSPPLPISYPRSSYTAPEAGRNIFAF